jgi:hypothetical protein
MAFNPEISGKAGQALGLPPGFKIHSPFPFKGMNFQDAPHAIEDQEFVWIENFVRLGNGRLRSVGDNGPSIYTAPTGLNIVYFRFYTLAVTQYCAIFLSDGSAIQLTVDTREQKTIGPAGTFYNLLNPTDLPFARQWGSTYLLICNRNTVNDYWAWDGSLLYGAGTAAPQGVTLSSVGFSYSSQPVITAYGGKGSGMTFSSVVNNGGIAEINITNSGSGYLPGDVVQLAFSDGGSDTSAQLQAVLSSGSVGGVSITAAGSGYTTASIAFSGGGGGSGAAGTVIISTGSVTSYTSLVGGTGYANSFAVGFSGGGGGTGAAAIATAVSGAIVSILITNGGTGYTSAPTMSFTSGGGTGGSATAVITGAGLITGVTITNGGTGYTTAPSAVITGTGGSGATAQAVLVPAGVASVTVVNGGTGFTTTPLLTFKGGGGAGATGIAVLSPTSIASIAVTAGGSGYTSAPSVHFIGGGTGATLPTATANLVGATVGSISITNAGSNITAGVQVSLSGGGGAGAGATVLLKPTSIASVVVSSVGQFYTSAPAVEITPGANNSAYATVSLMPYGVSGSAMETYLSRVWIVDPATQLYSTTPPGNLWSFSAPGSIFDFATSDGGGNAVNTDAFLQTKYVNVRQSSGYLYFFGDGSVSVVSNVNTAGTPTVTTYNYQNVDPQAGLKYRDSIQDFGKSIVISNEMGIYAVFGGSLANISQKLTQLFTNAVYPEAGGITPSSAIATIYNIKYYINYLTVIDPDTFVARNVMLLYNEKDWTIASQSGALTFVGTQKISSEYRAWGTDGTSLYQLFDTPSSTLTKRIDTKVYGADKMFIQKQALAVYMQATDHSTTLAGITGNFLLSVSGIALQNFFQPSLQSGTYNVSLVQPNFQSPSPYYGFWGSSLEGVGFVMAGLRFSSTSPDFTLGHLLMGYSEVVASY